MNNKDNRIFINLLILQQQYLVRIMLKNFLMNIEKKIKIMFKILKEILMFFKRIK